MGFVEKVKNVISKLRAAGKTEKEVSEIIEQAAEAATVGLEKDGISGASGENQGSRRRKPARCSFESGNQCKRGIERI